MTFPKIILTYDTFVASATYPLQVSKVRKDVLVRWDHQDLLEVMEYKDFLGSKGKKEILEIRELE